MATDEEITKLRLDPKREKYEARQRAERYTQDTEEDLIKLDLDQARTEYNLRLQAEQEEREPYSTKPQKKMGILFFLSALLLSAIGDVIDFFTGGTIGWLVGLFIDAVLALMFGMSSSGRKQFKKMLVGFVGETIPIVAMLPFRTITTIWSFVSSRSKVAERVSSAMQKVT